MRLGLAIRLELGVGLRVGLRVGYGYGKGLVTAWQFDFQVASKGLF